MFDRVFRLWRGLQALTTRRAVAQDIDAELQSHIAYATDDLIARGVPRADARRQALVAFGGLQQTREWVLRERALGWWFDAMRDTRIGTRRLRKEPWSSTAIVLVVAVGIACVTSVFSLVNSAWLRPLPFVSAEQLVLLRSVSPQRYHSIEIPLTLVPELRQRVRDVAALAVFDERQTTVRLNGGLMRINRTRIDEATLALLQVVPIHGRVPTSREFASQSRVALISDSLWRTNFASGLAHADTTIEIGGTLHRVIGVMPDDFRFHTRAVIWTPLTMDSLLAQHERTAPVDDDSPALGHVIARLGSGMTRDSLARRILNDSAPRDAGSLAQSGWRLGVDDVIDRGQSTAGYSLAAAAFFVTAVVLLVVCANVMNILLARGHSRRREMALSAALGASAARLLRQLLTECLLLAAAAGLLGTVLSAIGVQLMLRSIPRQGFPGWLRFGVDWRVLVFAFAISMFAMLLFGLLPAREASRIDPIRVIHDGESLGITGRGSRAWSARLISVQLALSLVLVVASVLMVADYRALLEVAPTYPAEQMIELRPLLDEPRSGDLAYQEAHTKALARALRHDPRVAAVSVYSDARHVRATPGSDRTAVSSDNRFFAAGDTTRELWRPQGSWPVILAVDTAYFCLYRRRFVRGRGFAAVDSTGGPLAVVLNQRLAKEAFGNISTIGQTVRIGADGPVAEIIGVVADVPRLRFVGGRLSYEAPHEIFLADVQAESGYTFVAIEAHAPIDSVAAAVRNASVALDSMVLLSDVHSLADNAKRALTPLRLLGTVLSIVAALTLGIASLGLFGLVRVATQQRQREIGIRLALGATPGQVERLLLRDALRDTRAGLIGGALIAAVLVSAMLPRLAMGTFVLLEATLATALILGAVVLMACWIPVRRASRMNPNEVLRRG